MVEPRSTGAAAMAIGVGGSPTDGSIGATGAATGWATGWATDGGAASVATKGSPIVSAGWQRQNR